jgi:hypothetical protein
MGKRAGGKDFAPRVRSLVDQVFNKLEENGDARDLLEKQFKEDFAGTLRAVAAYAPKQIDMSVNQEDAPETIGTTDWTVLREARKQLESKHAKTTH